MNDEVVEIKINEHTEMLKEHDKRLDKVEQDSREFKTEIKNLCDNIKSLTNVMKWFICAIVGSFISFFFYAIQNGLFK